MKKSEKGSVTLIVLITVLFILALLGTTLIFVSSKRRAQLQESMILQNVYDMSMVQTYQDVSSKKNADTVSIEKEFNYTGNVQTYEIPESGNYLLEVYGAQGGSVTSEVTGQGMKSYTGGKGGYSKGTIYLQKGQTLYICVGEKGIGATQRGETIKESYNGGGGVTGSSGVNHITASGGGATHIATKSGTLAELNNFRSNVLIVAGGGGGARNQANHATVGRWGNGGTGGGLSGGGAMSSNGSTGEILTEIEGTAGTQTSGNAFGKGQTVTGNSGGGGGWYGGKNGNGPGGGGSGYIDGVQNGETQNGIKSGNGYARITFLSRKESTETINIEKEFDFTGNIQTYQITESGNYLLAVYGAQGGSVTSAVDGQGEKSYTGGKGGYSRGIAYLEKGQTLYICVGEQGIGATKTGETIKESYNGGGGVTGNTGVNHITASGGGATHIATKTGTLANLKDSKESVLIVAGGGGGARNQANHLSVGRWGNGGTGGGLSGGGAMSSNGATNETFVEKKELAGTQNSGYEFGKGQTGSGNSGGGGGWFGGKCGNSDNAGPGSGGSGYIGGVQNGETQNGIKSGNGYAIIKFINK